MIYLRVPVMYIKNFLNYLKKKKGISVINVKIFLFLNLKYVIYHTSLFSFIDVSTLQLSLLLLLQQDTKTIVILIDNKNRNKHLFILIPIFFFLTQKKIVIF